MAKSKNSHKTQSIEKLLEQVVHDHHLIDKLTDKQIIDLSVYANQQYRKGEQKVSDNIYDHLLLQKLAQIEPNHFLLTRIDDDIDNEISAKIPLPEPMLSTQKAYKLKDLKQWLDRIIKAAIEIDIDSQKLIFKITPKLDGFAAYFDGKQLITRGNGVRGTDISRALQRGLIIKSGYDTKQLPQGAGEIVIKKSYFYQHLAQHFEHPRNFIASIIKEKPLDDFAQKTIKNKAVFFIAFNVMTHRLVGADELLQNLDYLNEQITQAVDFEVDGLVIELANSDQKQQKLKEFLGSTRHHHRWQIAYKKNTQSAKTKIISLDPQTGRTGKITPVASVEPVKLSGALIQKVSAHNYALVKEKQIGIGAQIEIIRSGEVIPKIIKVLQTAKVQLPTHCPSCKTKLIWQTQFLICPNHLACPEQIQQKLTYFFSCLDNLDGFGPATIQTFYQHKIYQISQVYQLSDDDLAKMGFAAKTRFNLLTELTKSQRRTLEDWRFLAAFGIERLGESAAIKLLEAYPLEQIFALKVEDIAIIDGFAHKTAQGIIAGLAQIKPEFDQLKNRFNLQKTAAIEPTSDSVISGLNICFTGKMQENRDSMQENARKLGAKIQTQISKNTDLLVIGENAGLSKLEKAKKLGIKVITQKDYLQFIS